MGARTYVIAVGMVLVTHAGFAAGSDTDGAESSAVEVEATTTPAASPAEHEPPATVPTPAKADELVPIFELNVIEANDLSSKYDTPLKRKTFAASKEYGELLAELKKRKTELLEREFFVEINGKIPPYDLRKHRFLVETQMLGSKAPWCIRRAKTIDGFEFLSLPFLTEKFDTGPLVLAGIDRKSFPSTVEQLAIAVSEDKAKEIEDAGTDAVVRIYFRLAGLKNLPAKNCDMSGIGMAVSIPMEVKVFETKDARLVVVAKSHDAVLFEQKFTAASPKKK